jgi:hypothetical protein
VIQHHLGYLPDPHLPPGSKPDWSYDTLRATKQLSRTPGPTDLRPFVPDILNQAALGSCVVNAGFGAIRLRQAITGVEDLRLGARLLAYIQARAWIGQEKNDFGCHIRDFFRSIAKYGYLPELDYPFGYDIAKFATLPRNYEEVMRIAYDQKDKGDIVYTRIYDEGTAKVDRICEALDNGLPVVFGCDVTNDFCSFTGFKVFDPPTANEGIAGGHAMYAVGHGIADGRQDSLTAAGSWSEEAHDHGYHHFSFDYVQRFTDCWVVEVVTKGYSA